MGNPFKLKARGQDDLVDAGGDGSPSVSSKNEETSTPPAPPESSVKLHVSAKPYILYLLPSSPRAWGELLAIDCRLRNLRCFYFAAAVCSNA